MDPSWGHFLPRSPAGCPLSRKRRRRLLPPTSCRGAIPGWDPWAGAAPPAVVWACCCTCALGHLLSSKPAEKTYWWWVCEGVRVSQRRENGEAVACPRWDLCPHRPWWATSCGWAEVCPSLPCARLAAKACFHREPFKIKLVPVNPGRAVAGSVGVMDLFTGKSDVFRKYRNFKLPQTGENSNKISSPKQ